MCSSIASSRVSRFAFLHLWKTAGSSLHRWFQQIEPRYRVVSAENRVPVSLWLALYPGVGGHWLWEHLEAESLRDDTALFTVLRDPVERTLSQFYFNQQHAQQALVDPGHETLEAALLRSIERGTKEAFSLVSNVQTAVLAGAARGSADPEERLGAALDHLQRFSVVGTMDRLDVFLSQCAGQLSVKEVPSLERMNARQSPIQACDLPDSTRRLLSVANQLDTRLYQAAHGALSAAKEGRRSGFGVPQPQRFGNLDAEITHVEVQKITPQGEAHVAVEIRKHRPGAYFLGVRFLDERGETVFGTTNHILAAPLNQNVGRQLLQFVFGLAGVAPQRLQIDVSLNDAWSVCDARNAVAAIDWDRPPPALQVGAQVWPARAICV